MILPALEEARNSYIPSLIAGLSFETGLSQDGSLSSTTTLVQLQCSHSFQSCAVLTCKLLAKLDFQEDICNYPIQGRHLHLFWLWINKVFNHTLISEHQTGTINFKWKDKEILNHLLDQGYELHYKLGNNHAFSYHNLSKGKRTGQGMGSYREKTKQLNSGKRDRVDNLWENMDISIGLRFLCNYLIPFTAASNWWLHPHAQKKSLKICRTYKVKDKALTQV